MTKCKLCGNDTTPVYNVKKTVTYDHCHFCDFISRQSQFLLENDEEKARYDTHQYDENDHYFNNIFLSLIEEYIKPTGSQKILDYGSGPFEILVGFLDKQGYDITPFDPYYHNDPSYQSKTYDLIVSTEVIEHFYDPIKEFEHLISLLNEKGYLLLMTNFRTMPAEEFHAWWYHRDNTHVSFYNLNTFSYLEKRFNLKRIKTNEKNIILLQKN